MKTMYAWHIHHNALIERLDEAIQNRATYIKRHKSEYERERRLKRLKEANLPDELILKIEESLGAESIYDLPWLNTSKEIYDEILKLHSEQCKDCEFVLIKPYKDGHEKLYYSLGGNLFPEYIRSHPQWLMNLDGSEIDWSKYTHIDKKTGAIYL